MYNKLTNRQLHDKCLQLSSKEEMHSKMRDFLLQTLKELIKEKEPQASSLHKIQTIINYLNNRSGSRFKVSTKKTQSLIKARLKEKYTVEDFQKVIDIKTQQWLNSDLRCYLRPKTLFAADNFEGYLNEWITQQEIIKQAQKKRELRRVQPDHKTDQVKTLPDPKRVKLDEQLIKNANHDDWKNFFATLKGFLKNKADKFGPRDPIVKIMYIQFLRNKYEQ